MGDVAIPTGARLISGNGFVVVEAYQKGSLQCYTTTSNHFSGKSSTEGVSGMKTLHFARDPEAWYLGAKALKHAHPALCDTCNKAKVVSRCAYAMAMVARTGTKDVSQGFWTHPGAAEAVHQARALSHRAPQSISCSPCGEMTASTVLLRR